MLTLLNRIYRGRSVRNMVINYPFHFPFLLLHLLKHFHYFLGNEICLERYFSHLQSMYYLEFHAKLATERKLRGVSTRLPIPEALCWKHVWNIRSATTISTPRPRPSGYQKYILMSPLNS